MASLRRNKTLSPDGQTARFLYTIIKQLDLKTIDWNLVAGSLDITNGHAARMRYSRFKQHMEGATTQSRAPRAGKKEKEGKEGKEVTKKRKKGSLEEEEVGNDKKEAACLMKTELGQDIKDAKLKREDSGTRIKDEGDEDTTPGNVHIKQEPGLLPDERAAVDEVPSMIKMKQEPGVDDSTTNPDIWRILPRPTGGEMSLRDQTPRTIATSVSVLEKQAPYLAHSRQPNPPSTVSLAELEVSPRCRPTAIIAPGAEIPRSSFTGRATGTVKIKTEPGSDVDWTVCQPSAGVVVKSEPVET